MGEDDLGNPSGTLQNGSSTSPQQEVLPFPVRFLNKEQDENRFPHIPKHNSLFPVRFLFKEQ